MKRAIIATLLSLLVFPGSGHVWLKKHKAGMNIILVSLLALSVVVSEMLKVTMRIVDDITTGQGDGDITHLTATVMRDMAQNNNTLLNAATTILLLCWIASAVDAFRIGLQER